MFDAGRVQTLQPFAPGKLVVQQPVVSQLQYLKERLVATNLAPHPSNEILTSGTWSSSNGTNLQASRTQERARSGTWSAKYTVLVAVGASTTLLAANSTELPTVAGEVRSMGVHVYYPGGQPAAEAGSFFQWMSSPTANLSSSPIVYTPLVPDTWNFIKTDGQIAPVGVAYTRNRCTVRPLGGGGAFPVGTFYYLDDLILSSDTKCPPYFSGDTPDTASYRYDWLGAQYNSRSTKTRIY